MLSNRRGNKEIKKQREEKRAQRLEENLMACSGSQGGRGPKCLGRSGVQVTETQVSGGGSGRSGRPRTQCPVLTPRGGGQACCAPQPCNTTSSPGPADPRPGRLGDKPGCRHLSATGVWVTNVIRNWARTFLSASLGKHLRQDAPWGSSLGR